MSDCKRFWWVILIALLSCSMGLRAESVSRRVVYWGTAADQVNRLVSERKLLSLGGQEITNAVAIAAGDGHALALLSDGRVLGAGKNYLGQAFAGNGEIGGWVGITNSQSFRFESSYLRDGEGLVSLAGQTLAGVKTIATGVHHNVAVRKDGTVVGWGADFASEKYQAPIDIGAVKLAACGRDADWFVLADGSILEYRRGRKHNMMGLTNVVEIVATIHDRSRFVALQKDGRVCFGSVREGIHELHPLGSNVKSVAAGGWQILALHADGSVTSHGGHVPEGLLNIIAIAVGQSHSLALRDDGRVVSWGANKKRATIVPTGLSHVTAIAAGNDFSLAITTNAAVAERFRR
jgi:alpha-tubulin suppressor-like RCC1 family protein